jgi:hypothetical protein
MSKQQMGAFASRILGVLAFIWALGSFQTSSFALATLLWQPAAADGHLIWLAAVTLLTFVIFIGCGVWLLLGADRMGAYLAGRGDNAQTATDVTVRSWPESSRNTLLLSKKRFCRKPGISRSPNTGDPQRQPVIRSGGA